MSLDRSKAPEFKIPDDFEIINPVTKELKNGAFLYYAETPGINAIKLELVSKSNRNSLPLNHSLIPSFTLQMLQEGTTEKSGEEIADFFDFHAAELNPFSSYSREGLGLYSTKKHIFKVLPTFCSLLTKATFPEQILEKRKSQRKLSIRLSNEKTASRANQLLRKSLFGEAHPFGFEPTEEDVSLVTVDMLRSYYQKHLWEDLEIFVSGDLNPLELDDLVASLESLPNRVHQPITNLQEISSGLGEKEFRESAVQSSIRIGHWSIPKNHPDYIPLSVFNTILGGYFGSRLIKNIREDKGHTYGISSGLAEIGDFNYWVISADVQKAHYQECLTEIFKEIANLIENPMEEDEIEVVRNYLIGKMLAGFSSTFDLLDQFKAVHFSGMDFTFFEEKLKFLKRFTAEDVQRIGKTYFSDKAFIEIVVG
ncbi:MAG: zinc protease [Algoriphagus sp.]|mgnify:CR=1 FL=1|jgi:zinc protease|tara:strand:- start:280 stop:1551 length:1272 start_codon:yes stop_codon:yes gene_type:complete